MWASWNGATGVAQWEVLAGPTDPPLTSVKKVSKSGFETHIALDSTEKNVRVRALDQNGQVLGTSSTVHPSG